MPSYARKFKTSAAYSRPGTFALTGVFTVAVLVRCLYLWQIHNAPFYDLRLGDGQSYHLWAHRIAAGDWLGHDIFYQSPLYPYFLAIVYRLLGDGVTTVRILQAFLGALSCTLLAAAGMVLFGRRGALAGLALSLYPPAIFLDGQIDKSCLTTLFVTALLLLTAARRWFLAGVALGLLALTRENALVLLVPIIAFSALETNQPSWKLNQPAAVLAGCFLILIPVGLRNVAVGGEFHFTTAQLGPNLYIGNHPGASGAYEALILGHGSAADERDDATHLAEFSESRKLTPGQVSSYWESRALHFAVAQPAAWFQLFARKLALTFNASEITDTESQSVYAEYSWLLRMLRPFDFGIVCALAAFAFAPRRQASWLLFLAGAYTLSVAVFYVVARYRFPLVPILLLYACGATIPRTKRAVSALAVIGALAVTHIPLVSSDGARATTYFSMGSALAKLPGRSGDATAFYRRALQVDPGFPAAQFGIATLLTREGNPAEALPYFQSALATWPNYEEAHYNLALALSALGRAQDAAQEFTQALNIRPDDVEAHLALARTLLLLNRGDLSLDHYRRVLSFQPDNVKALVGLGVALTQCNRYEEAIQQYRRAVQLEPGDANAEVSWGSTLANQGLIAEALPHYERAVLLNPDDLAARRNLETARQLLSGH